MKISQNPIKIINNNLITNKRPNFVKYFYQQNHKANIFYYNYYEKQLADNCIIYSYEHLIMDSKNHEILQGLNIIIPKNYYWVDEIKFTGHKNITLNWNKFLDNNNQGLGFLTDDINKLENYKGACINIKNKIAVVKFMDNQNDFYPLVGGINSIIDGPLLLENKIYFNHKYRDKVIIIYHKN